MFDPDSDQVMADTTSGSSEMEDFDLANPRDTKFVRILKRDAEGLPRNHRYKRARRRLCSPNGGNQSVRSKGSTSSGSHSKHPRSSIRGNQTVGSKITVPEHLPACTIQYGATCVMDESGEKVTFDLGCLDEKFSVDTPDLRARADEAMRKLSGYYGVPSVEEAGMNPQMRSYLGESAMKFMLSVVACALDKKIMEESSEQVAMMQESVKHIMIKESMLIAAAGELQSLGESPNPDVYNDKFETAKLCREQLTREILMHASARATACSALVNIDKDDDRSDLIGVAALVTHSLIAQPGDEVADGAPAAISP